MNNIESKTIVSQMFDFLEGINIDPEFLKPATKCMVAFAMVQYFLKKGAKADEVFKGVDVTLDHISNGDNWICYRDLVVLMKNCHDAVKQITIYDWLQAGIGIAEFTQTKKYALIADIVGIKFMYRKTVEIMPSMNTYAQLKLNKLQNGFCDCSYFSESKFNRFGLGHAAQWVAGVLAAIPIARGYKSADVRIIYSHHSFRNLIEVLYDKQNFDYEEMEDGNIFIDDELKAKRVELIQDKEAGLFSTEFREGSPKSNAVIVIDKVIKDGVVYVKDGEIFDAPYGRFQLNWEHEKRLHGPSYYFKRWSNTKFVVSELETQILTADRKTIEAETARDAEKLARIRAETAEKEVKEYADKLEDMVEERTKVLRETQAKLIEAEKRTLEHRITGGFAHEMRNALAGAQLEFKTALNYKDKGKPSAEILKESAITLLNNISLIHEKHNISREEIATLVLPELKTIAEIADHLADVHSDVSSDLDRGLSITTQIRDYARMSELRPGDENVDIVPMLKGYEQRYSKDFERTGITYTVEGIDKAVIKADEIHINSIFSNLILNAKDALEEFETDRQKEIKVSVDKKDGENGNFFIIKVQDNGPGIPEEHLNEIFEPFFSTKPTSGTGLGLGIVKRLVQLYGGLIEVESRANEGTTFIVSLHM